MAKDQATARAPEQEPAAPPSARVSALAVLGLVWASDLVDPADAVDPSLTLGQDGYYRGGDEFTAGGLTLYEALGMTLAVIWADEASDPERAFRQPVTAGTPRLGARVWRVQLPGAVARDMTAADACPVVRALLVVRRTVWPAKPWRPRDPIAEQLERNLRAIEAELRGPALPVQVLRPAVIASDIGRDWSR